MFVKSLKCVYFMSIIAFLSQRKQIAVPYYFTKNVGCSSSKTADAMTAMPLAVLASVAVGFLSERLSIEKLNLSAANKCLRTEQDGVRIASREKTFSVSPLRVLLKASRYNVLGSRVCYIDHTLLPLFGAYLQHAEHIVRIVDYAAGQRIATTTITPVLRVTIKMSYGAHSLRTTHG